MREWIEERVREREEEERGGEARLALRGKMEGDAVTEWIDGVGQRG